MNQFNLELEIITDSMLHIGTGEGFAGIIDRKVLTHQFENNRLPIILGHTVKGIIRDQYRKLSGIYGIDSNYESTLFGTIEKIGSVHFSPWVISDELKTIFKGKKTSVIFDVKAGNQIIRSRRVAKPEHLFTHEVVRDNMIWKGTITGTFDSDGQEFPNHMYLFLLSLKSIKKIGGRRRSGIGTCTINIKRIVLGENEEEFQQLIDKGIKNLIGGRR